MLVAVSQRYPVVFAYIGMHRDFTIFFSLKKKTSIGFLIPKNIIIDILFMSLWYVVAKLFVNMFVSMYAGGHLGFRHFGHFLDLGKNAIPFSLILIKFWFRINWKINSNRQNARKCYMWHMSLHYQGGGPGAVVEAAYLESRRMRVRSLAFNLKNNKLFFPAQWFNIVGRLRNREVPCSATDHQGPSFSYFLVTEILLDKFRL